jgi:hypothetical protein
MVRILYSIISGANVYLPSLICSSIIQFRSQPGHGDIPFGYLLNVLATDMLVAVPVGDAPIQHLIFNNTNLNKMKLKLALGQVDIGEGSGAAELGMMKKVMIFLKMISIWMTFLMKLTQTLGMIQTMNH